MMKSTYLILLVILVSSCQVNSKRQDEGHQSSSNLKDISYYQERGYQIFQEYGFAIKAPCLLEDISQQVSGEWLLNYGGIANKESPEKRTFYQLAVNRLPVGYKDIPADKLKSAIDSKIRDTMKNLKNCKFILFGYEEYQGYVGECITKGYTQKGVVFLKDNYIICLTVISNDNLEEKFNKFTNSFKTIKEKEQMLIDSINAGNPIKSHDNLIKGAKSKDFKKGVIQHSLNTKWSEFADRSYYSYIKTLKSGMKLYRAEATNMMMEVYVLKGYIKIQSSNIILHDKTSETLKSMDAWLMSCNPLTVIGDISSTKEYNFHDYDIMLRKLGTDGIHYMISSNSDTNNQSIKATTDPSLNKQYSNEYFSIKYPTTWQIVQDDNQVTGNTTVSVQIMEKLKNDHDFRPNINIIVSKKKWSEPTSYLAQNTIAQNKQIMDSYHLLEQNDDIYINNCQGSVIDYTFNIQGYKLHGIQYIVKKKDNTTFIITATTDAARHSKQKVIANTMINSLKIK